MADINVYRSRIGTFNYSRRSKNYKFKKFMYCEETGSKEAGQATLITMKCILKTALICLLLPNSLFAEPCTSAVPAYPAQSPCWMLPTTAYPQVCSVKLSGQVWGCSTQPVGLYQTRGKKQSNNFLAKYLNGNIRRGILNLHLNIRSVKNKILFHVNRFF